MIELICGCCGMRTAIADDAAMFPECPGDQCKQERMVRFQDRTLDDAAAQKIMAIRRRHQMRHMATAAVGQFVHAIRMSQKDW